MLNFLFEKPQNIVVVGDVFVSCDTMEAALRASRVKVGKITRAFWGSGDKDEFAARQLNLERRGPEAEAWAEGLEKLMGDCDVLLTHFNPVPQALIDRAPRLKAVLTCRGGLEHIDVKACSRRNIPVVNVIRNAVPVAEFTIGMMLALTRNIAASHHLMIEGCWKKEYPNSKFTSTLGNLTVGLAGLGNVGIEVATRLKALGVPMIAFDAYADPQRLRRNGLGDIRFVDTLEELFSQADIVSLHLRLTPETEKSIDRRYFSLMKPTAYFINTARGGLVNQEDLLDTLRAHAIAGAALDVFDKEPVTAEAGFAGLDNVVLTAHLAGATEDAIPKAPYLLMREVDRIAEKGTTERIVNFGDLRVDE
ncbi:MAG: 2-hydroxyacid dehydrogenase [Oscillibacter sp.]|nr:2-hydroxyacid dehydrogenase [Oscillibacter sp.]